MRFPWQKQPERRAATDVLDAVNERRYASSDSLYMTPGQSVQRVAVFAAVNFIATTCSQMPCDLYRGEKDARRSLPHSPLLTDPGGEGYGFSDWAWNVLYRGLLQGNAVGVIAERDNQGYPTVILLKDLARVMARYGKDGRAEWQIDGKPVPADSVFHFRAFPQEQSIMGLSPIGLHMRTVGINAAAEEFGAAFYADGAHPTALLISEQKLTQDQARVVKNRFVSAVRSRMGEPVVLPADIKYQPIQIPPIESQFLETQKYSATECARIFGPGVPEMLGFETGNALTYANVESRSLHVLIYTLNAWLRRLEGALSSPRMTPRGQYVRFNRNSLLQATTLERYRAYELALRNQFQTVNEVRDLEDWAPVPWGEEPIATPPPAAVPADDNEHSPGGVA